MASIKESIKEMIRKLISEAFDDYVSDEKLKEAGWEFLRSELGLVGWDSMQELYYTRSKAVGEAQTMLWRAVEKLAREYKLNTYELWENYVIEPAMMLDNSYEDILKDKGLKDIAEYVSVGYDDREGGFFVTIHPDVVYKLLDADVDKVAEKFVKEISEKELNVLEQEYWKKVEEYKEEGWEVDEKEILKKVAEDYLLYYEETLAWLYIEESKSIKKFIEAVEEMERELVAYLSDVDYKEELIRDALEVENFLENKNL